MNFAEVTLPAGFAGQDGWRRDAILRPLCGHDEAFLLENCASLSSASRTTALLARCLHRLGPMEPVAPEAVRMLTVGDREALLLHLRRLTLGEKMGCVLKCPNPSCSQSMELNLEVSELLLPPYNYSSETHERTIVADAVSYRVRFRLPNGSDHETAASLAVSDPDAIVETFLRRCVQEITNAASGERMNTLPAAVAEALDDKFKELDPQAEIMLDLTCPACGASFCSLLDSAAYLHYELVGERLHFYRQVHSLAFHYHWSQEEILSLTPRKRQLYFDLLSDTLERRRGSA
jgi:hypothetical protein